MATTTYKLALIGDACVGKTNLVRALKGVGFEHRYFATAGTEVHPIPVRKGDGGMFVDVWDQTGSETRWYGDSPLCLADKDLVVIAYALDSKISYRHALGYWTERAGTVPIIMVGLKADIEPTVVPAPTDLLVSSKTDPASVRAFLDAVVARLSPT